MDPARLHAHRSLPDDIANAESEPLEAMRDALHSKLGLPWPVSLGLFFLPPILVFGITGPCIVATARHAPSMEVPVILLGVLLPMAVFAVSWFKSIPLVSLLYWHDKTDARVDEALETLRREAFSGARPGRCASCGGKVQVPHLAAVFQCPFCESTLIASDGMLLEWKRDAWTRGKAWRAEAKATLERLASTMQLSPVAVMGRFYGVAVLLGAGWLAMMIGGTAILDSLLAGR